MTMYGRNVRLAVLLVAAAIGCGVPGESLTLDGIEDTDPRYDHIRRAMDVTVVRELTTGAEVSVELAPESLSVYLNNYCNGLVNDARCAAPGVTPATCSQYACAAERAMCATNEAIRMADSPNGVRLAGALGDEGLAAIRIPSLDPASRAAVAQLALQYASFASWFAQQGLSNTAVCSTTNLGETALAASGSSPAMPRRVWLATVFGEAVAALDRASGIYGTASMAFADMQFATQPDRREAAALALTAPLVSRGAAAVTLVGGTRMTALGGSPTAGFCDNEHLSAGARRALELLRSAAPPPLAIMAIRGAPPIDGSSPDVDTGTVTLDELVIGWNVGSTPDRGLRDRWSVALSMPSLRDLTTASAVLDAVGTDESSMVEARSYLANELRVFGRSTTHTMPDSLTFGTTVMQAYAATRTPPERPLRSFLTSAVRYRDSSTAFTGTPPYAFYVPSSVGSVDAIIDWAYSSARRLAVGTLDADARQVLADIAGDAGAVEGRLEVIYENHATNAGSAGDNLFVRLVTNRSDVNGYEIVRGRDGLECAVRGAVDGAPCSVGNYIVSGAWAVATDTVGLSGFARGFQRTISVDTLPRMVNGGAVAFYVVRERGMSSGAGGYDEVTGAVIRIEDVASSSGGKARTRVVVPIVPRVEDQVVELVAMSGGFCGMPATSCAGVRDDLLLPLENELTSDGDDVESSWKHYLQAAQTAASEADMLGEALIRTGQEMDARSELAVAELQRICGAGIDVTSLRGIATAPRIVTQLSGARCPGGYTVQGTQCILDPLEYAIATSASDSDAERLRACLGTGSRLPFAALGNLPLCVWVQRDQDDQIDPQSVCRAADPAGVHQCPEVADGACTFAPPGYEALEIPESAALSLFAMPVPEDPRTGGAGSGGTGTLPCTLLANVRNGDIDDPRAALEGDGWFDSSHFAGLARGLEWSAMAGDYSTVFWNDSPLVSTGRTTFGVSEAWPCDDTLPVDEERVCAASETLREPGAAFSGSDHSLFCVQATCSDAVSRARMNDMLARAVMAARLLGGESLAGLEVPWSPRSGGDTQLTQTAGSWEDSIAAPFPLSGHLTRSSAGTLFFHSWDGGAWDQAYPTFSDLAVRGSILNGGAEWRVCPYDRSLGCTETFDDAFDADDVDPTLSDRNLPFMVRTLPSEVGGSSPSYAAGVLWGRAARTTTDPALLNVAWTALQGGDPRELLIQSRHAIVPEGPLNELTRYWARVGCGRHGCRSSVERIIAEQEACYQDRSSGCTTMACSTRGDHEDRYFRCREDAPEGVDFFSTFDGNRAFIAHRGLTRADLLNGMELLCYAERAARPDPTDLRCGGEIADVSTVDDLLRARQTLSCQADAIRTQAALTVVRDLPTHVAQILPHGAGAAIGTGVGDYDSNVRSLAADYLALRDLSTKISSDMDALAGEIAQLEHVIQGSEYRRQILEVTFRSETLQRGFDCAGAIADAAVKATEGFGAGAAGAITGASLACANAFMQTNLSAQVHAANLGDLDNDLETAFVTFDRRYGELISAMSTSANALNTALQRIDAAQAAIRSLQQQGRAAAARALFLDRAETGRVMGSATAYRRRYSTDLYRYREAHERAVRLAYIARLALEQRLGMPLESMVSDLDTVDAPAHWANEICSLPAIDYDRIRDSEVTPVDGDGDVVDPPEGYSGAYVGDYVRRLLQVWESYSFRHPFQEGLETSVISVRDDLLGLRADCEVESHNLLFQSGYPDRMVSATTPGWEVLGCQAYAVPPPAPDVLPPGVIQWPPVPRAGFDPPRMPPCVSVSPVEAEVGSPFASSDPSTGRPRRISMGGPPPTWSDGEQVKLASGALATAYRPGHTALTQTIWVERGRYRISWYEEGAGADDPAEEVDFARIEDVNADESAWTETSFRVGGSTAVFSDSGDGNWARYWFYADVPSDGEASVVIRPPHTDPTGSAYIMTGFMVEAVGDEVRGNPLTILPGTTKPVGYLRGPRAYEDTQTTRTVTRPVCADDGELFQRSQWSYACERSCPADATSCSEDRMLSRCYYELPINLNPEILSSPEIAGTAGFARGNFNYRIESLALNFVGRRLRDCGDMPLPGCYADGNVAYELVHHGPYLVENALGQIYSAPLFVGRIRGASGLALERYVGNPISSADQGLLAPYTRVEMRGRPLHGAFLLRVWDDPGFRFDRLEDVQIVLRYRYWQHQR